jgi:hypothetical protein
MRRIGVLIGVSVLILATAATPATARDTDNFAPASRTVAPQRVYATTGTVRHHGASTVLAGAGASITYDFGKEVGGLVTLRFGSSGDAGQRLGLAFTESSQYVGTTSDASNGGDGPDGAVFADVTPGAAWTMPAASLRGGFRYLTLFAATTGSIAVDRVSLAISFAPSMANLRDYANSFHSSDPLLNRIWYAGAYTVQTNTIAPTTGRVWGPPATGWDNSATVGVGSEVLVDGAKRDRTVWPGDLGVSVPTEYASLGDVTPTRNALTTLYDHQAASGQLPYAGPQVNFYGSDTYHLWTLIGTATYYQYSHDNAWLDTEWANYVRAVDHILAQVGADGLMTVQGTADWARSGQGGENTRLSSPAPNWPRSGGTPRTRRPGPRPPRSSRPPSTPRCGTTRPASTATTRPVTCIHRTATRSPSGTASPRRTARPGSARRSARTGTATARPPRRTAGRSPPSPARWRCRRTWSPETPPAPFS